jgi:hypothetical protein
MGSLLLETFKHSLETVLILPNVLLAYGAASVNIDGRNGGREWEKKGEVKEGR